jgi:glycosyltransferase involved in cell wall biosynthesis
MSGSARDKAPLVSVLIAARDAAGTIGPSVASALRQSLRQFELIMVDDYSHDGTADIVEALDDPRVQIVRLAERHGLAGALRVGLSRARARFVARLDADDIALPKRLETQYETLRARPDLAILGSAALALESGLPTRLVLPPQGRWSIRWAAHFSSPFLHPTVMFDRSRFVEYGLEYDPAFEESEDYDLWSRALAHLEGENLSQPCTLYRVHSAQASQRRRPLQREYQRRVAARSLVRSFPDLAAAPERFERIWAVGVGEAVQPDQESLAVREYLDLLERFSRGAPSSARRRLRSDAARLLVRRARASGHTPVIVRSLRLDPRLPAVPLTRLARLPRLERQRRRARRWLAELEGPA